MKEKILVVDDDKSMVIKTDILNFLVMCRKSPMSPRK